MIGFFSTRLGIVCLVFAYNQKGVAYAQTNCIVSCRGLEIQTVKYMANAGTNRENQTLSKSQRSQLSKGSLCNQCAKQRVKAKLLISCGHHPFYKTRNFCLLESCRLKWNLCYLHLVEGRDIGGRAIKGEGQTTKVILHCKYVPFCGHLKHKPDLNFGELLPVQTVYCSKQCKPIKLKELGTEKEKWVLKLLERIISMKTEYPNTLKMQVIHSQIALQSSNFSDS